MIRVHFSMSAIPRLLYTHLSKSRANSHAAGKLMKSRQALRVVAAGTIGNVLEWYDFAICNGTAPCESSDPTIVVR